MDNFDLKKYLVENKVTRNSRMIRENEDGSWLQIVGAFGGMHSERAMYDVVDFTGGIAEMKAAVRDLIARGETGNVRLTFNDSKVVAFESDNQEFVYFVKKDAFPGPVDEDFVNNIEDYVYNRGMTESRNSRMIRENKESIVAAIEDTIRKIDAEEEDVTVKSDLDPETYNGEDINIELVADRDGSMAVVRYLEDYDDQEEFENAKDSNPSETVGYVRNGKFTPTYPFY